MENGTHVLFGTRMSPYATGENTLAKDVLGALDSSMLCLADRGFFGYEMWRQALATNAQLLWRMKKNAVLPCDKRLADGSYLSRIYPSEKDKRHQTNAIQVRVIEYRLEGVADAEPIYRLATSVMDTQQGPAQELAALYHERWEIETALDELKTHLRGAKIVLRSKTPDLVRQEFYGLLMAHFAVRALMHEAALKADVDCRHLVVPPRRARRQAQTPRVQRYSPLCRGRRSMSACSTRSCRSGSPAAAAGEICAASNAR